MPPPSSSIPGEKVEELFNSTHLLEGCKAWRSFKGKYINVLCLFALQQGRSGQLGIWRALSGGCRSIPPAQ